MGRMDWRQAREYAATQHKEDVIGAAVDQIADVLIALHDEYAGEIDYVLTMARAHYQVATEGEGS